MAAVLLACVVALSTGCDRASSAGLEQVVRRLDAHAFAKLPRPRHGPVAQIGDEARNVVFAPEELLVAEALGVVPSQGVARLAMQLPEAVRREPDSAFVLTTQELPFALEMPPDVRADVARKSFSKRPESGWRIVRDPNDPAAASLEVEHQGSDSAQLNLRVTALMPSPPRLLSEQFAVPDDARIQLGFGLVNAPREGADGVPVQFLARIECRDGGAQTIVDRTLEPGKPESLGWHDVSVDLEPGSRCRLKIANRAIHPERNGPPLGAVWSVPQILAPAPAGEDLNLLLVSLDTLRADHLSGYGYPRPTSPTIDRELIQEGAAFTDVIATYPQTDVSHVSIFTGLYAKAQPTLGRVAPEDGVVLLAEALQDAGFETAAFTEDALVSGAFGFWFGFDRFTERAFAHEDRGRTTFEDGIRYLETHRDQRFFLFLHTYKTHDPYVARPTYDSLWSDAKAWDKGGPNPRVPSKHRPMVDRYDRTIREADDLMATLLDALDRLDLTKRTIIAVLSDHGEAFGEHGPLGHGFAAHQEQLGVPLILRGPGIPRGLRVEAPASLVDVAPTLLELLDLAPLPQGQGVSLHAALEGGPLAPDRPLYFSWLRRGAEGVRRGSRKLMRTENGQELFDLAKDPDEVTPLLGPPVEEAAEQELLRAHAKESELRRESLASDQTTEAPAISERTEKSLKALGYL